MSIPDPRTAPTRLRFALLAFAGLLIALLVMWPHSADAKSKHHGKKPPKITVMTRNLYLGADLSPAINASTVCDAVDAAGNIINQVDASNFPARAKLLGKEIASAKPGRARPAGAGPVA